MSQGDRLALYRQQHGVSSLKLFAILEDLGWGLKRNVRDLYMFACQNYHPGDGDGSPADHLYALNGFSRGAFTIRVLVEINRESGTHHRCPRTGAEAPRQWAYRDYRHKWDSTGGLVRPFRWLRDRAVRMMEFRKPQYDSRRMSASHVHQGCGTRWMTPASPSMK